MGREGQEARRRASTALSNDHKEEVNFIMRRYGLCLVVVALFGCNKSDDPSIIVSSTVYPLRDFLNEAEFIGVGVLTAPDPRNFRTKIRIVRSLKGKTPLTDWTLDATGLVPSKAVARHLVEGSPVVVFAADSVMSIYLNRFFINSHGDPSVGQWTGSEMEGQTNQTFNGPALELVQVCEKVLKGEMRPPRPMSTLPPMDTASVRNLPAWNEDVSNLRLPAPFRRAEPPAVVPRPPEKPESTVAGLAFSVYEGGWNFIPDFNPLTPLETGVTPQPGSRAGKGDLPQGLRFRGFLEIPKDGDYAFSRNLDKDCNLELLIGSSTVSLVGPVPEYIPLLAGKHAVTLRYSGTTGEGHFQLFWSGPDLPKEPIPAKAWSHYRN